MIVSFCKQKKKGGKLLLGDAVGQRTQMVWLSTQQVSCAQVAFGTRGLLSKFVAVCRYSLHGNVVGITRRTFLDPSRKLGIAKIYIYIYAVYMQEGWRNGHSEKKCLCM